MTLEVGLGLGVLGALLALFAALGLRSIPSSRLLVTPFLVFGGSEIGTNWLPVLGLGVEREPNAILIEATAFAAFLLGFGIANGAAGGTPPAAWRGPLDPVSRRQWLPLAIGLIVVTAYYYRGMPPVWSGAASYLLDGTPLPQVADEIAERRFELTRASLSGGGAPGLTVAFSLMRVGWPMLAGLLWIRHRATGRGRGPALAATLAMLLTLSGNGERFPAVQAVVYLLVVRSLLGPIGSRRLVAYAAVAFATFVALSATNPNYLDPGTGSPGSASFAASTAERLVVGNGAHTVSVVRLEREGALEHQWGYLHLQKALTALPGVTWGDPFSARLADLEGSTGRTTLSSSTYLAIAFLDFTAVGAAVAFFVIGLVAAQAQRWLARAPRTATGIALSGFVVLSFWVLQTSSPIAALVTLAVAVALAFVAGHRPQQTHAPHQPRNPRLLEDRRDLRAPRVSTGSSA